jgi:hypothetical protein
MRSLHAPPLLLPLVSGALSAGLLYLAMLLLQHSCVNAEVIMLCAGSAWSVRMLLCLVLLACARFCLLSCPLLTLMLRLFASLALPVVALLLLQRGHRTCRPQGSKRNAHKRWRQRGWRMGRCVRRAADDSKGGRLWPGTAAGPIRYTRDAVCAGEGCTTAGLVLTLVILDVLSFCVYCDALATPTVLSSIRVYLPSIMRSCCAVAAC